jgi:hypothetical protein
MERLNNRVDHKNFLFLGEINVDGIMVILIHLTMDLNELKIVFG